MAGDGALHTPGVLSEPNAITPEAARKLRENVKSLDKMQAPELADLAKPRKRVTLIAFCDGSYKKIAVKHWKHSQWIHFTTDKGNIVRVNPANVNYLEEMDA